MKREWKPIEGYENYQVSNYGEVKSLNYHQTGREKLLKPQKCGNGYLQVRLSKNGVVKPFGVHRLVYETFVGEIPEDLQCNHIDENKENNRVDNLNLMTPKENINWGTHNARVAAALRGKPNSSEATAKRSKTVEAINKVTGRVIFTFPSTNEAHRQGFDHGAVAACCRNCYSTHKGNVYKGFIWQYKDNIHVNQ